MKTRKTSSKLFAILSLTRLLTSSIHVSTVCQYGLQNAVRALSTLICINNPHQPQLGPSTPLPWVQELNLRSGLEAGPSFSFVMVMPGCSYCHFGDWLSGLQLYFTCCCFFLKKLFEIIMDVVSSLPTHLLRSKIQDRVLGEGTVPGLLTLLSDMALSVPKQCFFPPLGMASCWCNKLLQTLVRPHQLTEI